MKRYYGPPDEDEEDEEQEGEEQEGDGKLYDREFGGEAGDGS